MVDWPHSPVHRLEEAGAYIVTAGTYLKQHFFAQPDRLTLLQDTLLEQAGRFDWRLQAWAVLSNHYHFVGMAPSDPSTLVQVVKRLHSITTVALNKLDGTEGRRVWFEYWDTHLTYEKSYLARLNYVHQNPVKHGLVTAAERYPWCSAGWFERTADHSFYRTVCSFKTDRITERDDFQPEFHPVHEPL